LRTTRGELGVYERSGKRNRSPRRPCTKNQERSVDLLRYDIGIDENSRAYDAAHDEHHGVEQPQSAKEARHQSI
jgi:hypothetical protein